MYPALLAAELRRASLHAPHIPREDLAQVAALGLHTASRRYDPSRGASLATFARRRIRGALLDEIRAWSPLGKAHHATVGDEGLARYEHQIAATLRTTVDSCEDMVTARVDVHRAIQALPARLQTVLQRVYWDGARLCDVARELGVTEGRVCQLRTQALRQMRRELSSPRRRCM